MQENQVESCQKCLLKKFRNDTKKSFTRWFNQKKAWRGVFKIGACAVAKYKIILSWTNVLITLKPVSWFALQMKTLALNKFTLYSPVPKQQKHLVLKISHATILCFKNAMQIFHSEVLEAVLQRCLRPITLLKKWILITPFLQNTCWRLLLKFTF